MSFVVRVKRLGIENFLISASEKSKTLWKISSRKRVLKLAAIRAAKNPTTTEAAKLPKESKTIRIPGASRFQAKISFAFVP